MSAAAALELHRALHQACKDSDEATIRKLVQRPDLNIDFADENGLTPLEHSLFHGSDSVAKLLLESGASVNHKAKDDVTPIHTAALGGSSKCVSMVISYGADLDAATKEGLTALHYAADGHTDVCQQLVQNGANVDVVTKHIGYTPLHKAAFGGHTEVANIIASHSANLEIKNINGNTPLHVACREGHIDVAHTLVSLGASLQAKNKAGKTPYQLAIEDRQLEVVSWMDSLSSEHGPLELVCAIEDCLGGGPDNHLGFNEGDFITVVKKPYEDWWIGKVGPTGKEGLFCTLMVDTRPLDPSEGKLSERMMTDNSQAQRQVLSAINNLVRQAAFSAPSAIRSALNGIMSYPLLADRADVLTKVPEFSDDLRKKYCTMKAQLAEKDKGPATAATEVETASMDLVHAAVQAHEKQSTALRKRIHDMLTSGEANAERAEQLQLKIKENSTKMKEWKTLMSGCPEARIFCSRLYSKLAEMFMGIKAIKLALLNRSCDEWDKSSSCISLLDDLVPLPGFSLILDSEQGSLLLSRARVVAKVKMCAAIVPHVSTVDEVSIGTALAVVHAYINQIKQLTPVGAAMLADGAVGQVLEYLRHDCPEHQGTMVTIEALSRSIVFARRGNEVAKWLKTVHIPLQVPDPEHPWTINGIFRETGVRTPDGKKHRGRDTRTDLYGYRNGSYLESKELCMAPAGEEHTLGPRRGKIQRSTMTTNLFRRPTKEKNIFARGGAGARSRFAQRDSNSVSTSGRAPSGTKVGALALRSQGMGSPRGQRRGLFATSGSTSSVDGSGSPSAKKADGSMLRGLSGTVDQLREGAELNQAQMRAMFDRMCALSAEVDHLKGHLKSQS